MHRHLPVAMEPLIAIASLYWLLAANPLFFRAALAGRLLTEPATWGFLAALAAAIFSVHFLLLALLANRWTVKPLLAGLVVVTALATYFMQVYGIYLDPTMLRNALRTDMAEARELWSWSLLPHLALYAALPLWLLSRVQVQRRSWARALAWRLGSMGAAVVLAAVAVLAVFQPLASMMRNHKEMRYLVTPANVLWSTAAALGRDASSAARLRLPLGEDAARLRPAAHAGRPQLLVLVVGETARAANWGLSGYARPTTPELARLSLLNFADVTACGTNTETSVPCLFAPVGRRDYDEARIRGSESMLHLLQRAGVAVHWRDNQSGCKGVCDGLPQDTVAGLNPPGLCSDGRCLDEGLLAGLDERLARAQGSQVLVLHMLGNHGPSYFRRYPPAFAHFQPACQSDDLRQCSPQQITNAYDNALRYTDHVLASLVAKLQAQADRVDTAMLFVSDHGESLGEMGLYLHGMPYAIAPREQTQVPMLMWLSDGWASATGLDLGCLRARAAQPVAHDHVFHTVLGLLDVASHVYAPAWDLAAPCRSSQALATRS
jgi:lipid A ethanolaminephosphotransferase